MPIISKNKIIGFLLVGLLLTFFVIGKVVTNRHERNDNLTEPFSLHVNTLEYASDGRTLWMTGDPDVDGSPCVYSTLGSDLTLSPRISACDGSGPGYTECRSAISKSGNLMALSCIRGKLRIYDIEKNEVLGDGGGLIQDINSLAFSPNDHLIATFGIGELVVWDVAQQKQILHIKGINSEEGIVWQDKFLVYKAPKKRLILQNAYPPYKSRYSHVSSYVRTILPVLSHEHAVVYLSNDAYLHTVNTKTDTDRRVAKCLSMNPYICNTSPDGHYIALIGSIPIAAVSRTAIDTCQIIDTDTWGTVACHPYGNSGVTAVCFSPTHPIVVVAEQNGLLTFWNFQTGYTTTMNLPKAIVVNNKRPAVF